ncbi:hypothetical protein ASV16_23925 [Enterobacter cloacae subsp. cloacae]|nr:hypothetical protein ASV16_23925 [Enterobacter cloacae subsp. cloacae]KUQ30709.1 hypothetical protein AWI13_13230 [Enterobacter hormaechei subsp. xiangfangensis]
MVHQRVTRIDHCAAIGITHCIISWLTAIPSRQHAVNMLRRYAITNAVYQSRQRDEIISVLIGNNQLFGYQQLILRWASGTQIKAYESLRETRQPFTRQTIKVSNG